MRPCVLLTLLSLASAASAAPEDRGSYAIETWEAGRIAAAGADIRTQVIFPADVQVIGPLVVVMHGNLRAGQFHGVMAETLASRGFVVLLPDMPCGLSGCDHAANARQLSALMTWATRTSTTPGSRIFGRIDDRRALVGHSYGGLAAYLSTARDASVDVVVLLDPKDDRGEAEADAPQVAVPSAHLLAETQGACNGSWDTRVFPSAKSPSLLLRIPGSGHCDAEEPSESLCPTVCGAGDPTKSRIFRRYAVAMLECALGDAAESAPYLGGAAMAADEAAGTIDRVQSSGLEGLACRVRASPEPKAEPSGCSSAPDGLALGLVLLALALGNLGRRSVNGV